MEIDWTFGISDFVKDQEEMLREFEEARTQAVLDGQLSLLTQLGKHLGKLVWKYLVYVSPDTVGYITLISAALMMLSPLVGKGIGKPIGLFAASTIVGIGIRSIA